MRRKLFRMVLLIVFSILSVPIWLLAAEPSTASEQGSKPEDQKYAGTWVGSYSVDSGSTEKLSYVFSKDEKGQWRGTVKWTNQDGEQAAELKGLQIADGKLKGKVESPDGMVEVTIAGEFHGDQLEGTYSVSPKGSTEVSEKGTWKVKKSSAPKTGQ
jgi:hypothetical protein